MSCSIRFDNRAAGGAAEAENFFHDVGWCNDSLTVFSHETLPYLIWEIILDRPLSQCVFNCLIWSTRFFFNVRRRVHYYTTLYSIQDNFSSLRVFVMVFFFSYWFIAGSLHRIFFLRINSLHLQRGFNVCCSFFHFVLLEIKARYFIFIYNLFYLAPQKNQHK